MTSDKVWGEYPLYFKQPLKVCPQEKKRKKKRWKKLMVLLVSYWFQNCLRLDSLPVFYFTILKFSFFIKTFTLFPLFFSLNHLLTVLQWIRYHAHTKPHFVASIGLGLSAPLLVVFVAPLRRKFLYADHEPIPKVYPLPTRARDASLSGYDDE